MDLSPKEDIYPVYRDLYQTVKENEDKLEDSIPVEGKANLQSSVEKIIDDWDDNRKDFRVLPACKVYDIELSQELTECVVKSLISLDALIDVLDDIIDTQDLSTESRVGLTANAAFSAVLIAENAPVDCREDFCHVLRQDLTTLFQIPRVEIELSKQIANKEQREVQRELSIESYSFRSRVMDAFARLPAVSCDEISEELENRMLHDLRNYRARLMLIKDIDDAPRDLEDKDYTPVLRLLQQYSDIEPVATTIEEIYREFEYTDTGKETYGDELEKLIDYPSDLRQKLRTINSKL